MCVRLTVWPLACSNLVMAATIWKGRLAFGLVSIPIKLVRAARAEKIHMHKIQRETGARVRQVFVPADAPDMSSFRPAVAAPAAVPQSRGTAPPEPAEDEYEESPAAAPIAGPSPAERPGGARSAGLSQRDIVHGYEYEKDRYVQFEPEELARLAPKSSPDMEIVEFVHFAEVDPVYLETSYYVLPDAGGDKPYALLFETLKKTGYAAIGEFVMHRRDQIIILRPGQHGLIAHTMFYEDEVRRESEYHAGADLAQPKEMDLAVKLVEALAGEFEPGKFKDKYRERLKQAISEKVESGAITQTESPAPSAPVIDIMAALKESLARARKPVKSEAQPAAATKGKKRAGAR